MTALIAFFLSFLVAQDVDEKMTVTLRNVRVHVLDKAGSPVRGLTRDDFLIQDRGRQRECRYFEEVIYADAANASVGKVPRRQRATVVFVDSSYMRRSAFDAVQRDLTTFFETRIGPTDLVKLVHLDGGLRQLTTFTDDGKALTAGVSHMVYKGDYRDKMQKMNLALLSAIQAWEASGRDRDHTDFFKRLTSLSDARIMDLNSSGRTQLLQRFQKKGEVASIYYRAYLESLLVCARILEPIDAERAILLVDGGGYRRTNGEVGNGEVEKLAEDFSALLNMADITLYNAALQEPVPITGHALDIGSGGHRYFGVTPVGMGETAEEKLGRYQERRKTSPLKSFGLTAARETGGRSKVITHDDLGQALGGLDAHARGFYKIGYIVEEVPNPGKPLIQTRNDQYQVIYGRAFNAERAYDPDKTKRKKEALLLYGPNHAGNLMVDWSHAVFDDGKTTRLLVSGLLAEDEDVDVLDLAIAVLDEDHNVLTVHNTRLKRKQGSALGGFYHVLQLQDPPATLRLYAADEATGRYNLTGQQPALRQSGSVLLSDLVLAQTGVMASDAIDPRDGFNNPLSVAGTTIRPLPTRRVAADQPFAVFFHCYGLSDIKKVSIRFVLNDGQRKRLLQASPAILEPINGGFALFYVVEAFGVEARDATLEMSLRSNGQSWSRKATIDLILE